MISAVNLSFLLILAPASFAVCDELRRPVSTLSPTVEIEEDVYTYASANNGAGPMWCSGSTCLVRIGTEIFASGLETIPEAKPLNNCRWILYKREANGWVLQQSDLTGHTREPCPITGFPEGPLFLSANPTLSKAEGGGGPARPEILKFSVDNPKASFEKLLPVWDGYLFTEHSYRSFAADRPGESSSCSRILTTLTPSGPSGIQRADGLPTVDYNGLKALSIPKPELIRVCYPNVLLNNRAVYFVGVSDIIQPYPEWRSFKKQLTGQNWDYDFRRLFYTWDS